MLFNVVMGPMDIAFHAFRNGKSIEKLRITLETSFKIAYTAGNSTTRLLGEGQVAYGAFRVAGGRHD